jgi:hypothetical protein
LSIYVRREPPKYWLVESHREGSKVVQRRLKYLGSTAPTPEELARLKEEFKEKVPPRKRPQPKEEKK